MIKTQADSKSFIALIIKVSLKIQFHFYNCMEECKKSRRTCRSVLENFEGNLPQISPFVSVSYVRRNYSRIDQTTRELFLLSNVSRL